MVWKQDLAKLKQQFKDVGEPKAKPPAFKPIPKPAVPATIEEEDTLFLNAMGHRSVASVPIKAKVLNPPVPVEVPPHPPAEDFQTAMGGLKGLKPLESRIPAEPPPAPIPQPLGEGLASMVVPPVQEPEDQDSESKTSEAAPAHPLLEAPLRSGPTLIHLAAGMAIEVDGSLDLRGHTAVDALERFRERLQDGVFLGWRTFHVMLGPSEDVREAFHAFLANPEATVIARYAQAPVPMGGSQAWILYYASPIAH